MKNSTKICTAFCICVGGIVIAFCILACRSGLFTEDPKNEKYSGKEPGRISEEEPDSISGEEKDSAPEEEAVYAVPDSEMTGYYAYDTLSKPEKIWYLDIYRILKNRETEGRLYDGYLTEIGVHDIDRIFHCVLNDHPEFFYVDGYSYTNYTQGESTVEVVFSGTYTMEPDEVAEKQALIDDYVGKCRSGLPETADEYEKTKYVYEYVIRNTEYALSAPDGQNICSVFLNGKSVCQGYAKATQYLLNRFGVAATLVTGTVKNGTEGHAWNLVRIDGKYYFVDTTWGDACFEPGETDEDDCGTGTVDYDFLCVTTEQLSRTHRIDNIVDIPLCRDMDANYYVREGAYFTAYDGEALQNLFDRAIAEEREKVDIRCSNPDVYEEMKNRLIGEQEVIGYLPDHCDSVRYILHEERMMLSFLMEYSE